MAFSYSSAAKSAQAKGDATALPTSAPVPSSTTTTSTDLPPVAGPSKPSSMTTNPSTTPITHLILDAGPLLSLAPLRHLATSFHTTPMVLAELRDPKARDHWNRLALSGVDVRVEAPRPEAMARVVEFAKKTGDYAVLSQTDMSVVALTCQYEMEVNGDARIRKEPGEKLPPREEAKEEVAEEAEEDEDDDDEDEDGEEVEDAEDAEARLEDTAGEQNESDAQLTESNADVPPATSSKDISASLGNLDISAPTTTTTPTAPAPQPSQEEDDESDGGEWITPSNVKAHRSHDLGLMPDDTRASATTHLAAACMTGDYAVQNVLLGMGLGLVGEGGKRISKVRSWVLRCHACFKLCKDPSKRFCPSCGNATLLRTTVTTSATTGKQTIHLKKNFQYHLRGTKYSIPEPKPGRAKGQQKGGSGLILREDQAEWQDAVRTDHRSREKEERRVAKGDGGWNDPDWLPEIITVGMSGKGRSGGHGMPSIGHGRKNPNQSRRKR